MAWETRRETKARFYYRAARVGGRVRKTCYGSGPRAKRAAREDAQAKAARTADAAAARAMEAELGPLERLAEELDAGLRTLTEAVLLATGHREHHGQWRRRRHGRRREDRHEDGHDEAEHDGTAAGAE